MQYINPKPTIDTIATIGSMTKSVTKMAVKLRDELRIFIIGRIVLFATASVFIETPEIISLEFFDT